MTSEPVYMSNGSVLWFSRRPPSKLDYAIKGSHHKILHRADGPAIERPNGEHSWYWYGADIGFKAWAVNAKPTNDEMAFYVLKYF